LSRVEQLGAAVNRRCKDIFTFLFVPLSVSRAVGELS
jgi:hypothetical protein